MTRRETSQTNAGGSDQGWSLPLLFVLAAGILFQGGDWPPATFLIRAALFLLAARLLLRSDAITLRPTAPDLLVVSFLAVEAASLPRVEYPWVSYQWFLHHAAAFALYLVLRARDGPGGRFPAAAGVLILAAAAVEVAVAVYQRVALGSLRPDGTLENPNYLAEILLYGVIAASCFRRAPGAREPAGTRWLLPLVALFAAGIVLTGSRGVFLVALPVAAWLLAGRFGWKRTVAGAAVAAVAAGVVVLASGFLLDRFTGKGDPYAFERINMWNAALRIFADHPFGVGAGHFKYYWPAARGPVEGTLVRFARFANTPHAEFFSVLSELGVPGAAAFLGLGVAGILSLRRAARSADPAAAGAATILLASFLNSFFQTNYHVVGLLLLNAAALAVVSGRLWQPVWTCEIRVKGPVRAATVALLAVMAGYSAMTLAGTLLGWRGHADLAAGRIPEAARRFAQAGAADPWQSSFPDSASAARYRLYESGAGDGWLSLAIESEVEAAIRNPVDFRYPARLGFLYGEAARRFPGAASGTLTGASLAAYEKAVMLNPRSADIRYRKAAVLRSAGREAEARRLIEDVLADEPRFARGWAFLGALLEGADRRGAVAAYEKAAELYYTYGKSASDPEERDFIALDVLAVEKRARALEAGTGR